MFNLFEETQIKQLTNYFGTAVILEYNEILKTALLKIEKDGQEFIVSSRTAMPYQIFPGDTVLTVGENLDSLYVIGILNSSLNENIEKKLFFNNGSYALFRDKNNEKLQLFSKTSELIFEYDPLTNTSKINIQNGNLEITANGNINFASERGINFISKEPINLQSSSEIKMSLSNSIGKILSFIYLKNREAKISSPKIDITSLKASFKLEELKYIGNKFSATLKHGKFIMGKIENIAGDIICKAKNIYNSVENLSEIKAGRIRTLIKSTLHIKSKNSYLNSEKDFKINAEKIHLG